MTMASEMREVAQKLKQVTSKMIAFQRKYKNVSPEDDERKAAVGEINREAADLVAKAISLSSRYNSLSEPSSEDRTALILMSRKLVKYGRARGAESYSRKWQVLAILIIVIAAIILYVLTHYT